MTPISYWSSKCLPPLSGSRPLQCNWVKLLPVSFLESVSHKLISALTECKIAACAFHIMHMGVGYSYLNIHFNMKHKPFLNLLVHFFRGKVTLFTI